MLRARLKPLLENSGMVFDWNVKEEPVTDGKGGTSLSLNVLRIAQESITNALKHANASVIYVETDATSIRIKDNEIGLAKLGASKRSGDNSGIGLLGTQKRAKNIGAEFKISSSSSGTAVSLTWKPEESTVL